MWGQSYVNATKPPQTHTSVQHQSFSPVNRVVQFLDSLSKIRPLQRQRCFLGKLPVLADSLDQLTQSILSVPECCAHAVLYQSAFEIDRLPGPVAAAPHR
jgi:hypothetical protein